MLCVKISRCRSSGDVYTLQQPLQFEGLVSQVVAIGITPGILLLCGVTTGY